MYFVQKLMKIKGLIKNSQQPHQTADQLEDQLGHDGWHFGE
jgi:hypothetical protein